MSLTLLLQLGIILVTARACGMVLRAVGQPMVIGEMTAGIVLGPIVLGALFPRFHEVVFPPQSLAGLSSLATLGIVLFMFIVGVELRAPRGVRAQLKAAGLVSLLSMLLPLGLGLAIAPLLYPRLAPAGVGFWPFASFTALALSITAFPVLARILKDRKLIRTRVGQLSLSAAALLDVLAWILLALSLALANSDEGLAAFFRISVGSLLFVALVFILLKPAFAWLLRTHAADGKLSPMVLAALMLGLFACATLTEWLHLHAVFGAFLFGICLPRDDRLLQALTDRVEPLSIVVLMPVFFVLAGLGTTPAAFAGSELGALGLVLLVATVGKLAGGTAGARLSGCGWRESLATGALMNSRGLMELIVIKVGLDAGLIGAELFTMLLVMALFTTAATGPLLTLIAGRDARLADAGLKLPPTHP